MKTREKQTAKVVLLSIVCFILIMLLGSGILNAVSLRHAAQERALPAAIESLPLEKLALDEETAAEFILEEFVADERVSVENVRKVMRDGTFSRFAADLMDQYNSYLLEGGEFPALQAEDFVRLIEENEELIKAETGLEFLDPDKQKLRENLRLPLESWNAAMEQSIHRGVGGFTAKAMFSLWLPILFGVLLLAVMIWMIVFYVRGGYRAGTALKNFSIALFVPCAVTLLGLLFVNAAAEMNIPFMQQPITILSDTILPIAAVGTLVCAVLFGAGMLCNLIMKKPVNAEDASYEYDALDRAEPEFAEQPEEELRFTEPEPEMKRQFCRNCGQPLVNPDAKFCYKCGNIQEHVQK